MPDGAMPDWCLRYGYRGERVTLGWLRLAAVIASAPREADGWATLTQAAVAEALGLGESQASTWLAALLAAGWIERDGDCRRGRRRRLRLTPEGVRQRAVWRQALFGDLP